RGTALELKGGCWWYEQTQINQNRAITFSTRHAGSVGIGDLTLGYQAERELREGYAGGVGLSSAWEAVTVQIWGKQFLGGRPLAQQREAFGERVEATRLPGLEQARQHHAGLRALCTARAAADLANHHQWADAALGQVVVGAQPLDQHKLEQLVLVAQQPLGQSLTGMLLAAGVLQAQCMRPHHQ